MTNFLLDHNIAYFLLVLGSVLTLLAIITPGTGLLEVGAFFCLALAGYAIYSIGFNLWAMIILILSVIPFIIALRKPRQLWLLGLSILGIIIGSIYIFPSQGLRPAVNPFIALVVSLLAGGCVWYMAYKTMQAQALQPSHDLGSLIGMIGEAKTQIHDDGSVQVAGELWTARSDQVIKEGSQVRVVNREGFILVVEADNSK